MKRIISNILLGISFMAVVLTTTSCDKVSPTGILLGGSGTDDRVKMSYLYYQDYLNDHINGIAENEDYSFLIGSDSHCCDDTCRMAEMLQDGIDNNDLLYAHLGDIADTKPEYYIKLGKTLDTFKERYVAKYFRYNPETGKYKYYMDVPDGTDTIGEYNYADIRFPFFPVVGNHDITHNGWALYSNLFHSSFYEFTVRIGNTDEYDHFIFLDSANGTLGTYQTHLIDQGILFADVFGVKVRHRFVFTHTNLFRPSSNQFSSTYPREELYFLLNKFSEWNATIVFTGHVHKWDDRVFGGVRYLTLNSMSEKNCPKAGKYLVRVTCHKDGTVSYEQVMMHYEPK